VGNPVKVIKFVKKLAEGETAVSKAGGLIMRYQGAEYHFPPGTDPEAAKRIIWNKVLKTRKEGGEEKIDMGQGDDLYTRHVAEEKLLEEEIRGLEASQEKYAQIVDDWRDRGMEMKGDRIWYDPKAERFWEITDELQTKVLFGGRSADKLTAKEKNQLRTARYMEDPEYTSWEQGMYSYLRSKQEELLQTKETMKKMRSGDFERDMMSRKILDDTFDSIERMADEADDEL